MRTLVLILMLALVPLRMWAADGMAVRMALEPVAAAQMSAAGQSMPDDCPMMAKAMTHDGSQDEVSSTAQCLTCHLCAAAACVPDAAFEQGPAPVGPPESRTSRYLSANQAPKLRPPIS